MNRQISALAASLVLPLMLGAPVASVMAQAGVAPSGTSSAQPAGMTTASRTQDAQTADAERPSANAPSVQRLFCLNMTMQCFAMKPASASGSDDGVAPGSARTLDLRAPDIRRLVAESDLRQPLPDPYAREEPEAQVRVQGSRPEVHVPPGLMSLPWAVMHPTQAWRIFLPAASSQ